MHELELFEQNPYKLLANVGITHPLFDVNSTIIINTWFIMGVLFLLLLLVRWYLPYKNSTFTYVIKSMVKAFIALCTQNLGHFMYGPTLFILTLFVFIFSANSTALLPIFEKEPTSDLNTTFALGVIAFLYIQYQAINAHGVSAYIKEFFKPIFVMFPITLLGELAIIVSLSFRLYGNIFGGSVITGLLKSGLAGSTLFEIVGLPLNFIATMFFGFFEGLIQAFVFSMLTLTYVSLAVNEGSDE